jgi:glycosyltransferase involved in cell wall biosynthesis
LIAVVIPCFKSKETIIQVVSTIPADIQRIYVVDDHCPDGTGKWLAGNMSDPRLTIIYHKENQGVGGAVITGFKAALADGNVDIIVKIDSDGQMDPSIMHKFVNPILNGVSDYTKGNRFFNVDDALSMPKLRLLGNAGLSFLTKLSSGYWSIMDPTNGYVAIHVNVLQRLPLHKLDKRYFFESDMLFRLNLLKAVVKDIPMEAKYADEVSGLSEIRSTIEFSYKNVNRFFKRVFYNYFLRDFNPASLFFVFGFMFLLFGSIWGGVSWWQSISLSIPATSGTVMLSALPIFMGFQMLLAAFQYDVSSEPKYPVQ